MVLAHNLTAMNAQRQFNIVGTAKRKSTEKLSSGYKINRAADDAAGLSISEKMRKQIRGLDRASDNCQDGVSLCQVADGALAETQDMLQRLTELSVQAANGTLSSSDRDAIQKEVNQIKDEIDRISYNTKFNEVYPLRGNHGQGSIYTHKVKFDVSHLGLGPEWEITWKKPDEIHEYELDVIADASSTVMVDGVMRGPGETFKMTLLGFAMNGEHGGGGTLLFADAAGCPWFPDSEPKPYVELDAKYSKSLKLSDLKVDSEGDCYYTNSRGMKIYTYEMHNSITGEINGWGYGPKEVEQDRDAISNSGIFVSIHAGADSDMTNKIGLHTVDASAKAIGIANLNLTTEENATNAIDEVGKALQVVSDQRSYFGAVQNRMEHTIANLDNVVENTQSAESRIRDTDMAKEMVNNTKLNVLEQAVTSMLAQANQSTQGVLSLLQ